ncbi:MAG: phosphoribosylformylglycinamidine synthase subunit PurS [Candidatus Omnitrophota bacterium]|jgi:phosphoribosylformylglycinamidine synthase
MLEANIYITLKKTVSDPQGLAIKHALHSIHYDEVDKIRVGKIITLKLNIKSKDKAKERIGKMCSKLLANPIVEDYRVKIKGA